MVCCITFRSDNNSTFAAIVFCLRAHLFLGHLSSFIHSLLRGVTAGVLVFSYYHLFSRESPRLRLALRARHVIIPLVKLTMQMKLKCSRVTAEFWCHQFLHVVLAFFLVYEMRIGCLRDKTYWNLVKCKRWKRSLLGQFIVFIQMKKQQDTGPHFPVQACIDCLLRHI